MASKQNVVFAILLCIVYTCSSVSAKSEAQQKLISVVLKGRVVCGHACSLDEEKSSDTSDLISGAVVAVECRAGLNRKTNAGSVSMEGKTDRNGEFRVQLPGSIVSPMLLCSSNDRNSPVKGYCSARLLSSPQEKDNVPSSGTSSSDQLIFTSEGNGIRTFTFPSLSYHSGSKLCSHKILSDHESLRAGRALHEVNTGSSSNRAPLFPSPLPKAVLGFPPLQFPLPPLPKPVLGFPPLILPPPIPKSVLGFPPLDLPLPSPFLNFPPFPLSIPPLPAGIPFPQSSPFPSTVAPRFRKRP